MTLILGIDPGKATGMALYDLSTCRPYKMVETGSGIHGFKPQFKDWEENWNIQETACENFTLRGSNKFTANLDGVKIIGWLEVETGCSAYPEPSQHMSLVKKPVLTKMMKDAGFKIGAGHTRMALSVAVWYAAKVLKHRPTLELLRTKVDN